MSATLASLSSSLLSSTATSVIAAASASASATSTGTSKPKASKFDHWNLVFNVNVFLLSLVGIFIVLSVPRAIIRFWHPSEWTYGHWFHHVVLQSPLHISPSMTSPITPPPITPPTPAHLTEKTPKSTTTFLDHNEINSRSNSRNHHHHRRHLSRSQSQRHHRRGSDNADPRAEKSVDFMEEGADLHRNNTAASQHALLDRNASTASGRIRRRRREALPMHMPGWAAMFPSVANFIRTGIRPGYTLGKLFMQLTYFFILLYTALFKSNIFTDPVRTGFLAVSQIPIVVVLGTKNNLLGMMLGMGYERLNYMHRFAGRMVVLAANVHAIGYLYSWSLNGMLAARLARPKAHYGLVGLVCADMFVFFSISWWRTRYYQFFVVSHVLAVVIFLGAVCLHSPQSAPYVLIAVCVYAFDRLLRIIKTRYTTARLSTIQEMGMTRIEIPYVNAGWKPGQHVRIRVLSRAMGWFRWAELHPFTVANVAKSENGEGLVLLCKKAGDWTNRLFDLAKRLESNEASTGGAPSVRVLVEGPYGGPGHKILSSFSGAMFVAGGSGISFALGAAQDLVKKDREGTSRVKAIDIVWAVPDPSHLIPFIPEFTHLVTQKTYATVRIHVFYTRINSTEPMKPLAPYTLPRNLTIAPGRPKLAQILSGTIDGACALGMFKRGTRKSIVDGMRTGVVPGWGKTLCGVVVGVCGPLGLAEEVRSVVMKVDKKRCRAVGGVEIHEESFGW